MMDAIMWQKLSRKEQLGTIWDPMFLTFIVIQRPYGMEVRIIIPKAH